MEEQLIIVDENDLPVGAAGKTQIHLDGTLHRAFSVFIFDSSGRLLLQKRASTKYHSPNLWSNTCCGHPRPGELLENAAKRRLQQEMGIECRLEEIFSLSYRLKVSEHLVEHEFDHVFTGNFAGQPLPDVNEVAEWKWLEATELKSDLQLTPTSYTPWFHLICDRVFEERAKFPGPR